MGDQDSDNDYAYFNSISGTQKVNGSTDEQLQTIRGELSRLVYDTQELKHTTDWQLKAIHKHIIGTFLEHNSHISWAVQHSIIIKLLSIIGSVRRM